MKKIKQLQNNNTTPEQSRRLLELGVPAESADCVTSRYGGCTYFEQDRQVFRRCIDSDRYITCWSTTRLMEIYDICEDGSDDGNWLPTTKITGSYINYIIQTIAAAVKEGSIDFSKLEE